jgi:O-antigen/teichoic acid export membrane protein
VRRIGSATRRMLASRSGGAWVAGGVPRNTVLTGASTLVGGLVALALLPLLIDRIGATATGLFVFATTLTGYVNSIEYGLGMSVTKYVAEHRTTGEDEQLGSVLRASLAILLVVGVLAAVAIALLGALGGRTLFGEAAVRNQATPTLFVAAAIALLYWPSRIGLAALRGLERYDLCAFIGMAGSLVTLGAIYIVSRHTHSVAVLAALFGAPLVIEGVGAGVLAWPHLRLRRGVGHWRGAHLRPTLGFSAGMFLIGISDTFIYESDRLVVAAFVGSAAIVAYEAALRPHNGLRLISNLIAAALLSTSARLAAQDRAGRLRELVLVGTLYGIVLTIPLVVLTFVLARPILEAWIGHGYGRYADYVRIFVSYWLLGAATGALGVAIYGIGWIRKFVWLTVASAIATLLLSIGLTATWGTVGVIWGTVILYWLGFPIWLHFALRHVQISKARFAREALLPAYLPVAVWTVPVVALADLLHPRGLIGLGAFCAVALGVLWLAFLPLLRARWRRMWVQERVATGAFA